MKVINLFGGPSSGKSTAMAGLFYKLKINGHNAEMLSEYVKHSVYEGRMDRLIERQEYILAKQHWGMAMIGRSDQVEYLVTDSPILLSCIYLKENAVGREHIFNLALDLYREYDNLNFFIRRGDSFQTEGRIHDKEQSVEIDNKIIKLFDDYDIPYSIVTSSRDIDNVLYGLVTMGSLKQY